MSLFRFRNYFKVILLMVLLSSVSLAAQNLIPELLDQGLKLYARKDYSGAADYLGQVVDIDANHDQARYYLVFSLSMIGRYEKSLVHAKKLAQKYPDQQQYTGLVKQLENAIAGERKKRAQKKAAQRAPNEVILGGYQTKAVMREAKMSTTPRDIVKPRDRTPLENAVLLIDEENFASATQILTEILKNEPKNAKAMHYQGVMKFNSWKYEEAKEWFEKAVKADPKSFQSLFLLGDCFRAQENYAEAAKRFKSAIEVKKDVFAQVNLADCYIKQNKLKEAEKIYKEVIDKDANITDAALGLAQIKLYAGFTNEAAEMVNKVLSSQPNNSEAHFIKAQILLEGQLNDDASGEAKAALESFPNNLKYRSLYALALIRAYRVSQGLEEAASILKQNKESIAARLVIAEGLVLSGAYADADEHLEIVQKKGKHPGVSRLRALRAVKNGEMDKAKPHYLTYMQLSEGRPGPYMEYAAFLETSGNFGDALQAYEEIAEQFKGTAFAQTAKSKILSLEEKTTSKSKSGSKGSGSSSSYRKGKVKF